MKSEKLARISGIVITLFLSFFPWILFRSGEVLVGNESKDRLHRTWEHRAESLIERLQNNYSYSSQANAVFSKFTRRITEVLSLKSANSLASAGRNLNGNGALDKNSSAKSSPPPDQYESLLIKATLLAKKTNLDKFFKEEQIYLFKFDPFENKMRLIKSPGFQSLFSRTMEDLVSGLFFFRNGLILDPVRETFLEKLCQSFFGELLKFSVLAQERAGRIVPAFFSGKSVYLYWNLVENSEKTFGAVLVIIPRPAIPKSDIGLKALLAHWDNPKIKLFFRKPYAFPKENKFLFPKHYKKDEFFKKNFDSMETILNKLAPGVATHTEKFSIVQDYLSYHNPYFVCLATKCANPRSSRNSQVSEILLILPAFAWLAWFVHFFFFKNTFRLGIRPIFGLLFMMVAGIPFCGGIFVALNHFSVLPESIRNEKIDEITKSISSFETAVKDILVKYSDICAQAHEKYSESFDPKTRNGMPLKDVSGLFANSGYPIDGLLVADSNGKISTYVTPTFNKASTEAFKGYFGGFGIKCLDEIEGNSKKASDADPVHKEFSDIGEQFSVSLRNNDSVKRISSAELFLRDTGQPVSTFSENDSMYHYRQIVAKNGRAEQVLMILWKPEIAFKRYLLDWFSRLNYQNSLKTGETYATVQMSYKGIVPVIPPGNAVFWKTPAGRTLMNRFVRLSLGDAETTKSVNGFLTGIFKCRFMESFLLGSVVEESEIFHEIKLLKVICFFVFLSLGLLLILLFQYSYGPMLVPIKDFESRLKLLLKGNLGIEMNTGGDIEWARLGAEFNQMIKGLRERRNLSRFVSGTLDESLRTAGGKSSEEGKWRFGTILVSDVRQFTSLSEIHSPYEVMKMINSHLDNLSKIIRENSGIIHQFVGDAVIAVFWETGEESNDSVKRAAKAAFEIMKRHEEMLVERFEAGLFPYKIGVGLSSGKMLAINLGKGAERLEHLLLGETCKKAEKLESLSRNGTLTKIFTDSKTAALLTKYEFTRVDYDVLEFTSTLTVQS
ncbi:MAG: adenylate/guanylate cyclase domain-containing protein [Candidatus Riflebacteria bacterium]|nr:adenylate/guanylate cyclase domain-containing protein [Candidatus Riflebacteria bacterium]